MFKIADMRSMKERPLEYYPTTDNETISLGEALVLTNGSLTKCGPKVTPEFIAMKAVTDIETIPVVRVNEDVVLETTFAADGSSIVEGDKVTIHTDGLQVTATTLNGVFYVVKKLGSGNTGTYVRGMFRR